MNRSKIQQPHRVPHQRRCITAIGLFLFFCSGAPWAVEKKPPDPPAESRAHLERAYQLLNEKRSEEAVEELEAALKLDPSSQIILKQLGYTHQSLGQPARALHYFSRTELACQMTADLAPQRWKTWTRPYFADLYFNPIYLSRFHDTVIYSQARVGAELGDRGEWQPYFSARYTDDSESTGGHSPEIFSDNAAVFSAGLRYHPWVRTPLSFYGEAGRAYDLTDRSRARWRDDFRAGVSYFDGWTPPARCSPEWRFPLQRASSLYGDVSVYSRYDRNWIGYLQWREGRRLLEKGRMAFDGFLYIGGAFDSNDDYYNNIIEAGGGAALTPDAAWPFVLRYTVVKGAYIASGPRPASYGANYTEHRWDAAAYLRF